MGMPDCYSVEAPASLRLSCMRDFEGWHTTANAGHRTSLLEMGSRYLGAVARDLGLCVLAASAVGFGPSGLNLVRPVMPCVWTENGSTSYRAGEADKYGDILEQNNRM